MGISQRALLNVWGWGDCDGGEFGGGGDTFIGEEGEGEER